MNEKIKLKSNNSTNVLTFCVRGCQIFFSTALEVYFVAAQAGHKLAAINPPEYKSSWDYKGKTPHLALSFYFYFF